MARKRFTPEQVITMLREAEVLLSQSNPIGEVCRKLGISEQTYYRYDRRNVRGHHYSEEAILYLDSYRYTKEPREWLPLIPSFGVNCEFRFSGR